ncbi:UNVERIFIED_CONTAM: hypothetical protein K2H54_023736 [Gekko kuhli]
MLRKLTVEQINDWFTIGKAVSGVEFLGGDPRAALSSGFAKQPPPLANVSLKPVEPLIGSVFALVGSTRKAIVDLPPPQGKDCSLRCQAPEMVE